MHVFWGSTANATHKISKGLSIDRVVITQTIKILEIAYKINAYVFMNGHKVPTEMVKSMAFYGILVV